jgi:DNA-binding CsgD family transcriptional regulator
MPQRNLRLMPNPAPSSTRGITAREAEVLDLATLRRADIAKVLNIGEETVKTHLRHAYEKLGVETRAAAALAWESRRAA